MSLSRFLNRGRSSGVRQSIKSTISIGPLRRTFSSHQADGCAETVTKPPTRKIHVVKLIHPHVPYKASLKWMLVRYDPLPVTRCIHLSVLLHNRLSLRFCLSLLCNLFSLLRAITTPPAVIQDLVTAKASKTDPELRDVLFIVQHKPVFTLGKAAKHENVKFPLDERCPYEVHHVRYNMYTRCLRKPHYLCCFFVVLCLSSAYCHIHCPHPCLIAHHTPLNSSSSHLNYLSPPSLTHTLSPAPTHTLNIPPAYAA